MNNDTGCRALRGAVKDASWQDVEQLKALLYGTEAGPEVWKHGACVLEHKQRPLGFKRMTRLNHDLLPQRFGHDAVGQTGDDVIRRCEPLFRKYAAHMGSGCMDNAETRVTNGVFQMLHEIAVDFNNQEDRVLAHSLEDFASDSTDAGSKLYQDTRAVPLHPAQK